MLNKRPKLITPSSHVSQSKPYMSYGLGVLAGTALAVLYLFFAIRLISFLVFSIQEPPPVESIPTFAEETVYAAETQKLPDLDAYEEAASAVALMQAYLGEDLKSADLDAGGLLTINLRTIREPIALTEEQSDMVHGSYLDEKSRQDAYTRMGGILYLIYHHPSAAGVAEVRIQLTVPGTAPDGRALTVYDLAQGSLTRELAQQIDWQHITVDEFTRLIRSQS